MGARGARWGWRDLRLGLGGREADLLAALLLALRRLRRRRRRCRLHPHGRPQLRWAAHPPSVIVRRRLLASSSHRRLRRCRHGRRGWQAREGGRRGRRRARVALARERRERWQAGLPARLVGVAVGLGRRAASRRARCDAGALGGASPLGQAGATWGRHRPHDKLEQLVYLRRGGQRHGSIESLQGPSIWAETPPPPPASRRGPPNPRVRTDILPLPSSSLELKRDAAAPSETFSPSAVSTCLNSSQLMLPSPLGNRARRIVIIRVLLRIRAACIALSVSGPPSPIDCTMAA